MSTGDKATQLIFEVHKGQSQFGYFLLGVAARAIAFAIHDTAGVSLRDAPWPLGVAVALWAISFALGCFGLEARQAALASNAAFLRALQDTPAQARDLPEIAKAIETTKSNVEKNLKRPRDRFRWQQWTLFAGAVAYIAGHVMQMAATPPQWHANPGISTAAPAN